MSYVVIVQTRISVNNQNEVDAIVKSIDTETLRRHGQADAEAVLLRHKDSPPRVTIEVFAQDSRMS